jgi:hypothetical protein
MCAGRPDAVTPPALSYVVPVRAELPDATLTPYLRDLGVWLDVVVVDGSPDDVFAVHDEWWSGAVRHIPVDAARRTRNGKVGAVLTGVAACRFDRVVIADDDVRYDRVALERVASLLDHAEVVRPQNVFSEWSWHTWWDTGRTLLARVADGDWPGTLGVRRDFLLEQGGYDGDVLFENLELVRTVVAGGGRERVARDLVVPRVPPSTTQFWNQRVRQAYDELARPLRFAAQLSFGPLLLVAGRRRAARAAVVVVAAAELGRRRAHGTASFPWFTSLASPVWVMERAVTSWIALYLRVCRGGVLYRTERLRRAASPPRVLRSRARVTHASCGAYSEMRVG